MELFPLNSNRVLGEGNTSHIASSQLVHYAHIYFFMIDLLPTSGFSIDVETLPFLRNYSFHSKIMACYGFKMSQITELRPFFEKDDSVMVQ